MYSKINLIFTILALLIFGSLFLFVENINYFQKELKIQPSAEAENHGSREVKIGVVIDPERDSKYGKNNIFQRNYVKKTTDNTYYALEILNNYGTNHELIFREDLRESDLKKFKLLILAGKYDKTDLPVIEAYVKNGGTLLAMPQFLRTVDTTAADLFGLHANRANYNDNKIAGIKYLKILGSGLEGEDVYGVRAMQSSAPRDVLIKISSPDAVENVLKKIIPSQDGTDEKTQGLDPVPVGQLVDDQGKVIGSALIVRKIGQGVAVSCGLDLINAIALNRHPRFNGKVGISAAENMRVAMDGETFFKNLIEYSLYQNGLPFIFKWPHSGGAVSTVFDRDDIDAPRDYRNISERITLRQQYGIRGTTYIRIVPSSGIPLMINEQEIGRWEAAGSQVALHSEFNSEAIRKITKRDSTNKNENINTAFTKDEEVMIPQAYVSDTISGGRFDSLSLQEAFTEKKRAEELFGSRPYDEVAHGAKSNFQTNYWDVATRAGFLSDGYGGMLPVSGYITRLPSDELGFTLYAIPKHSTLESSFYIETKTLYENAKKRGMVFGFLSHSLYLNKPNADVKKYYMNGTRNALEELYKSFSEDDVVTLTAEEIRKFEDKRRAAKSKYFYSSSGRVSILDEEGDGVFAAMRGKQPSADKYIVINSETYSLYDGPAEFRPQIN